VEEFAFQSLAQTFPRRVEELLAVLRGFEDVIY
jgi:hypothetical protein